MIERIFSIDLQEANTVSNVVITQETRGIVTFVFKVYDGTNELDYTIFQSAYMTLSKNGRAFFNTSCNIDKENRCIRYTVEPEALRSPGVVKGNLDLIFPGGNLATTHFSFTVLPNFSVPEEVAE